MAARAHNLTDRAPRWEVSPGYVPALSTTSDAPLTWSPHEDVQRYARRKSGFWTQSNRGQRIATRLQQRDGGALLQVGSHHHDIGTGYSYDTSSEDDISPLADGAIHGYQSAAVQNLDFEVAVPRHDQPKAPNLTIDQIRHFIESGRIEIGVRQVKRLAVSCVFCDVNDLREFSR